MRNTIHVVWNESSSKRLSKPLSQNLVFLREWPYATIALQISETCWYPPNFTTYLIATPPTLWVRISNISHKWVFSGYSSGMFSCISTQPRIESFLLYWQQFISPLSMNAYDVWILRYFYWFISLHFYTSHILHVTIGPSDADCCPWWHLHYPLNVEEVFSNFLLSRSHFKLYRPKWPTAQRREYIHAT